MANRRLKLTVDRLDLGSCLHTALRKVCDSQPTSLAYNMIHLPEMTETWKIWLDFVWTELVDVLDGNKTLTDDLLVAAAHEATRKLDFGDARRNCLRITFELFIERDWHGMFAYAFSVEKGDQKDS